MAKPNRTCIACREKYSYCPDCSRADAFKPAWFSEFCSESCKDLWLTLTKYNMSMLSKDEARAIILNLDLKPIDTYVACVKRDYNKVMAEDKKPRRAQKKFEPIIEMVQEIEQPVVAESHGVVIEKENE